ncbi:MOSC domain-containing protein [Marinobacter sp. F4206]|uniref:MOSC domain-containing protein n=1 Tax=Marinobacter sp. F4206 TaxID=2861777 RepID=UPI001C5EC21F|nr:MOSC N-terminal beta barrel domain-containing protein [Marinobacter sp. F4206]MBW4936335.1 MOSC domain-containing protein [Marinobacter sp. F4206]
MNVHSLWVYPVKSLAGVAVQEFVLDDFGPAGDRRWMIIDEDRNFVTQRSQPELATIRVSRVDGDVEVEIPGQGRHLLRPGKGSLRALVWRDWVQVLVAQPEVNEALSRFCGKPRRFVFMPDQSFRRVDASRVRDLRRVSFADGFPLLITNRASLEELNGRLDTPVEMRRFRPNMVVDGAGPWEEDHWRALGVGDISLDLVKPCSRCVMTTVDPDAGVKDGSVQPLRTLSQYRRTEDGVIFGMNAIHESAGRVRVGDPVTITKTE